MASRTPSEDCYGGRFHVFLSPEAIYGLLTRTAEQLDAPKQLTRVCNKLPTDPDMWMDTRPDELRSVDTALIEAGMLTMWSFEVPRYRRQVVLTSKTVLSLALLADAFGICNHQRPSLRDNPRSKLSALLEAIGLGHLKMVAFVEAATEIES